MKQAASSLVALAVVLAAPAWCGEPLSSAEERRMRMVRDQIEARGVRDPRVLAAISEVPRHEFVPEADAELAYSDGPLPIGHGQTISQPFIVASMTELADLQPGDTVLEIGTGSGYQAAVLARLVTRVYSIEVVPELARSARERLRELGYGNVEVITGDGYAGLAEHAPFDAIVVTAAPASVPEQLVEQLAVGAKLVIPVGVGYQELRVIARTEDGIVERSEYSVRFVPLVRPVENAP